ncbi:hypothetical protein AB3S75_013833 [Citrus x aurantiifolia]
MRACPTLRRNQMLLTMQQICLLRGDESEEGRSLFFSEDMYVKRHWIIIISVVSWCRDFAVSSLRWRYLQFGWRKVVCVCLVYDVDQPGCMAALCFS